VATFIVSFNFQNVNEININFPEAESNDLTLSNSSEIFSEF